MLTLLLLSYTVCRGLWRAWLGGLPRDWPFVQGNTWIKYIVSAGMDAVVVWAIGLPWYIGIIVAVGQLLYWRGGGNGAMLTNPTIKAGFIRYIAPAILFAAVLFYWRGMETVLIVAGGMWVVAGYMGTWALRNKLPYKWLKVLGGRMADNPYEDGYHNQEPCHFAELFGGAMFAFHLFAALT